MSLRCTFGLLAGLAVLLLSGPARAEQTCSEAVLADWADGRLDDAYAPRCYRDALKQMPEDLRVYSSAPEDIDRALASRLRAGAGEAQAPRAPTRTMSGRGAAVASARPEGGDRTSSTPPPLLALAATLLLCGAGAAAWAAHRLVAGRRSP